MVSAIHKILLKNISYKNDHLRLKLAQLFGDPWSLNSEEEISRMRSINELCNQHLPDPHSILEIGSARGVHSELIRKNFLNCKIDAIEISCKAVKIAEKKNPDINFFNCSIEDFSPPIHYDLSFACEVLYYCSSPEQVLEKIKSISKSGVISTYGHKNNRLEPLINRILPNIKRSTWSSGGQHSWDIFIWQH